RRSRHDLVWPADRGAALARRACEHPDRRALLAAPGRLGRRALEAVRGWVAVLVVVVGVVVLCGVVAAASNGRDHTGDTVRAATWADAARGAVGAREGDLHAIRDEYQRNNYAARQQDGGSGDSVE